LHQLLQRQIDKHFPHGIDHSSLNQLLIEISETYRWFERDKALSDHAYAISEKEYQSVLESLRSNNVLISQSIEKLKENILQIDPFAAVNTGSEADSILVIINYLGNLIEQRKKLEEENRLAKEAAESAAKVKSEFLSVMSHEIKTPLNAIIGLSHLLMQQSFPPEQTKNIRILHTAAENLLNLINDILDYGKIESGKISLSFKPTDIRNLLTHVRNTHLFKAQEKQNTIKLLIDQDLPEWVLCDEVRLNQIMHNLVSNAVKFTSQGNITISATVEKETTTTVSIAFSVKDTGIGIPEDKQALIFERFTQAEADITRRYGGSGLGLSIVRSMLELFNSQIQLKSKPDRGSEFYFTLNLEKDTVKTSRQASGFSAKNTLDLTGVHVLIVDDISFNTMVAEQMLANANATSDSAVNGIDAVEKIKQQQYDLVLMDIQMPVMDGLEATQQIRLFNRTIPIIALTASSEPEVITETKDSGMNDFLMKPFNPNDFYALIYQYTKGN
jgi:signal transduction histidine kinase/CheY-like chemotaxis protein